jgi:hypothetical protein
METVFICSRLRGDEAANIRKAHRYAFHQLNMGFAAFAPHGYYTQFLQDSVEIERDLGLAAGEAYLSMSDKVAVYLTPAGISSGMEGEISLAIEMGKPVEWWFSHGEDRFEQLHHIAPGTLPTKRELMPPAAFSREVSGLFARALATGSYDESALDELLGTAMPERDLEIEAFWESRKSSEED